MFLGNWIGALIEPLSGRRLMPDAVRVAVCGRVALFHAEGLGRGDRVFIHYGNSPAFFIDLLAVWWLGACAAPIDPKLTAPQIETLARATRPRLSLIDGATDSGRAAALIAAGVRLLAREDRPRGRDFTAPPVALHLDDPAVILFTSGTTGEPKGLVHTHRSLWARWTLLREVIGLESFARTLCLLPTHHVAGLVTNTLFPWLHGADLYLLPPFRADNVAQLGRLIDAHEITFMSSAPPLWTLALRFARPPTKRSLRRVHCASAPFGARLWRMAQEWCGTQQVFNVYGMTETAGWIAGLKTPDVFPEDGLIGDEWGAEIRIEKPESAHVLRGFVEACAPEEEGHVWIRTPSLMAGYFERDDLTAEVMRQGWLATGDIGVIDRRGRLYLRGRVREEINKGGLKVHPADVDRVAAQFPAVADVCTFPVADSLYGEGVGIALVLTEITDKTLDALRAFMSARLTKHQMPAQWYVVDSIPRTSYGKINRECVAQSCAEASPYDFGTPAR